MIMVPRRHHHAGDLAFLDGGVGATIDLPGAGTLPLHEARERFERDYILRALAAQHGNISRTADALGVERSNLYQQDAGVRDRAGAARDGEEEAV